MRFAVSSPRVMTLRMTHMWILLNSAADAEQGQLRCLVGFIHLQLEVRHAYEFPQRVLPEPASVWAKATKEFRFLLLRGARGSTGIRSCESPPSAVHTT